MIHAEEVWTRTRMATNCGRCSVAIPAGAVVLEIVGPTWRKVRCVTCAKKPVPAVVAPPPSDAHVLRTNFAERVQAIRGAPKDFKIAQGERE